MVRVIAFDLDDTLYNATLLSYKSRQGGLRKMQEQGLELIDIEKAFDVLKQVVEEFGSNNEKHYDIFLQRIKNRPDIIKDPNFSISKYVACGVIGYHAVKVRHLRAYRDVKASLQKLKDMGFNLAIISDGVAVKQFEKLIRMDIVNYFDYVFISDEIGIKKPNPDVFKYCIEKMRIPPSEIIYVGDRLDNDIQPANEVGMHSVLIHRSGKYDPNVPNNDISIPVIPEFDIHGLSELFKIIEQLQKQSIEDAGLDVKI